MELEAKTEAIENVDSQLASQTEDVLDKAANEVFGGQDNPEESSPSEDVKETESTKEVSEDTTSQKSEETTEEEEVPKGFHEHPAWQRILKERDEARAALEEKGKADPDLQAQLEDFKKVTSSREYIEASMRSQGYTQEAIDRRLSEAGYEVDSKAEDDVGLVIRELGLDPNHLNGEYRATSKEFVDNVVRVADVLIKNRLSKELPKVVDPITQRLQKYDARTSAKEIVDSMQSELKKEGILEWKEVESDIHKFMDDNPQTTQEAVYQHFRNVSREKSFEKLRRENRQEDRNDKKKSLRSNKSTVETGPTEITQQAGESDDDFLNRAYESIFK